MGTLRGFKKEKLKRSNRNSQESQCGHTKNSEIYASNFSNKQKTAITKILENVTRKQMQKVVKPVNTYIL